MCTLLFYIQGSTSLNWFIRHSCVLEMQMNAVERIKYYSNIVTENYEGMNPIEHFLSISYNANQKNRIILDSLENKHFTALKSYQYFWNVSLNVDTMNELKEHYRIGFASKTKGCWQCKHFM